jgi:hypothetical protein
MRRLVVGAGFYLAVLSPSMIAQEQIQIQADTPQDCTPATGIALKQPFAVTTGTIFCIFPIIFLAVETWFYHSSHCTGRDL